MSLRTAATLALGLLLLSEPASAQSGAANPTPGNQGLGLYFSNIAGSGVTYQRQLGNGFGFHVSGIGWSVSSSQFLNFGGAVTKDIASAQWGRAYGLVAAGFGSGLFWPLNAGVNLTPGIGFDFNGTVLEFGYSFFPEAGRLSSFPGIGFGWVWTF